MEKRFWFVQIRAARASTSRPARRGGRLLCPGATAAIPIAVSMPIARIGSGNFPKKLPIAKLGGSHR